MICSLFPRIFLVCLALALPAMSAFSDPANDPSQIPPPQPPFVQTPPPGSTWSATVVYPIDVLASSNPSANTKSYRTAHLEMRLGTNHVSLGTSVDADGLKGSYYVVNGLVLQKTRNTGAVFVLSKSLDSDIFDLTSSSFPVVDWLSTANYVGVEKIGPTLYYKFHKLPEPDASLLFFNGERTAWIRVSDGYPLKVQLNKIVFTFSEVIPFPNAIDLPAEYQAVMDRQAAKARVMELLRK